MKKLLCIVLSLVLIFSLSACSSSGGGKNETSLRPVTSDNGGISYVVEGSGPSVEIKDHYNPLAEPVVLLDNDVLKAELLGTFEQKYGAKDDRKLGRGATIHFYNKSSEDLLIGMKDASIGNNQVTASNLACPNKCLAGKNVQINFIFYTKLGDEEQPIEKLEDINDLTATITAQKFTDENTITKFVECTFSVASGKLSEEKVEEPTGPQLYKAFEPIEASPDKDQVYLFEQPIVLVDNEYVKVEIIEFFQKNVNWSDEKGQRMERGITVKTTNKHTEKLMLDLYDLYIGDKQITECMIDGSITPIPGKSEINGYYLWDHAGHIDKNLEDVNEIYQLEGTIEVKEYGGDYLGDFRFSLS